jgi:hypothetical protein
MAPNPVPARTLQAPIRQPTTVAPGDSNAYHREWVQYWVNGDAQQNQLGQSIENTHALRVASHAAGKFNDGSFYYETDRAALYLDVAGVWTYVAGVMQCTQATLPTDLGASDKGFLAHVTDYGHLLQWSGTAWGWAPGDAGSGLIHGFLSAPTGSGWHLCDGSTVKMLNADGTLSQVTLPNLANAAYLKLATATAVGPNAASGQTAAVSAGTPSGTNSAPAFTGAADTTSTESADATVQSGSGATVAAAGHTHTVTPSGTVAAPTFTGDALAAHAHGPGTLDLNNTQLLAYFRQ